MLYIAERTGIEMRSCAFDEDHPIIYGAKSPNVEQQRELFLTVGVQLATQAACTAIAEWGGGLSQITHIIAVSSTAFSNPGIDYYIARELGLAKDVERACLQGVGCAGGLAGLRHAAQLACGSAFLGRPARILVVSVELATLCARNELDRIHHNQEILIPSTLFADAGSALILSNCIGDNPESSTSVYDLLGWDTTTVEESANDLRLDLAADGM